MKDMNMIEDMVAKMMTGKHMGMNAMKPKMEDGESEYEDGEGEDGESEGEETEITIKICGKDAMNLARQMLIGDSTYATKGMRK